MALKLPVLVRGINNLSDARYCAGMGADGLIFTLDPTLPGAVDVATVKELAGWVSGVELIGEFTPAVSYNTINEMATTCGLDRVLLHYDEATDAAFFEPSSLKLPVLVEVSPGYIVDDYEHECLVESLAEHFPQGFALITDKLVGFTKPFWRKHLATVTMNQQLWVGGDLDISIVNQALGLGLAGFVLSGGEEIKPGLRDFTELEAIFEALETDD